jgi:hypothetical protein
MKQRRLASAVIFFWVKAKVPETKGKSPERIQAA